MKKSTIIALLLIILAIPVLFFSRKVMIESPREEIETIDSLPEPEFAKIMFLGFDALAADFLYTRLQYYFGGHYITDHSFPLMERWVGVVMALNPTLKFIIRFGDSVLSSISSDGEEAVLAANRILDLGHKLYPDDYEFVFRKGYNYFYALKDMKKAYPLMYEGSRMKGAPENLFWLVTQVTFKGGDYKLGLTFAKQRYDNEKDPKMKEAFLTRIKFFSNLIALTDAVQEYENKTGKTPDKDLKSLITSGIIKEIPEHPYGGSYFYDEKDGKVKSTEDFYIRKNKKTASEGKNG